MVQQYFQKSIFKKNISFCEHYFHLDDALHSEVFAIVTHLCMCLRVCPSHVSIASKWLNLC